MPGCATIRMDGMRTCSNTTCSTHRPNESQCHCGMLTLAPELWFPASSTLPANVDLMHGHACISSLNNTHTLTYARALGKPRKSRHTKANDAAHSPGLTYTSVRTHACTHMHPPTHLQVPGAAFLSFVQQELQLPQARWRYRLFEEAHIILR